MLNTKRGFGRAGIIVVILLVLGVVVYIWNQKSTPTSIVLSPKAGDIWTTGDLNTIKLKVDPRTIPMVDTINLQDKDGKMVGTIDCLKDTDQHTEFEWNTEKVMKFCGAGPPEERYVNILPGVYKIVLLYDSTFPIESGYFSISARK